MYVQIYYKRSFNYCQQFIVDNNLLTITPHDIYNKDNQGCNFMIFFNTHITKLHKI
jgi:hypothetical protein